MEAALGGENMDPCYAIEVGFEIQNNRHSRCKCDELHRLLTNGQPRSRKDPAAHFYVAQLHHYGLTVVTSKQAAKKRLLAAFGDERSLQVPKRILDIERDLMKQYAEESAEAERKKCREETPEGPPVQGFRSRAVSAASATSLSR